MVSIGKKLRGLRKSKGLSQQQLADELDIKQSQVSSLERDELPPRLQIIEKLAFFFDVDTGYFVDKKPASEKKQEEARKILYQLIDQEGESITTSQAITHLRNKLPDTEKELKEMLDYIERIIQDKKKL